MGFNLSSAKPTEAFTYITMALVSIQSFALYMLYRRLDRLALPSNSQPPPSAPTPSLVQHLFVREYCDEVVYSVSFPNACSVLEAAIRLEPLPWTFRSSNDIFDRLDRIGSVQSLNIMSRQYRTVVHSRLFEFMMNVSKNLVTNQYYEKRGNSSRTLIGCKGVGKTTVLRTFAGIASLYFEKLITVYISFNHELHEESILTIVERILINTHGIRSPQNMDSRVSQMPIYERIEKMLTHHGKYLMLIVDEFDQLYRTSRDATRAFAVAQDSINELVYLGNSLQGRVYSLVCGSSAKLHLLMTCNVDDPVEFPRAPGMRHMNGSKFREFRLPSVRPTDVKYLIHILNLGGSADPSDGISLRRTVAFFAGCNARRVDQVALENFTDLTNPIQNTPESIRTMAKPGYKMLLEFILGQLYQLNQALFQECLDKDNSFSLKHVGTVAWESRFYGLSMDSLLVLWNKPVNRNIWRDKYSEIEMPYTQSDLMSMVLSLSDRDYIVYYQGMNDGEIYPYCFSQLLQIMKLEVPVFERIQDECSLFFRSLLSKGASAIGSSALGGAIGAVASLV
jgi:hypothetical protein